MKRLFVLFVSISFLTIAYAQNDIWQWGGTSLGNISFYKKDVFISTYRMGLLKTTDNGNTWTNLGLLNKDLRTVAFSSNGKIFVPAAGDGGIYVSNDSGATWIEKTSGLGKTAVRVIASSKSGQLYAGTWLYGVFKSTNDGDSWSKVSNAFDVYDIIADSLGHIFVVCVDGVYRSTDQGSTWDLKNNGMSAHNMNGISKNHKGELFATTWSGQIYKSTNSGDSWTTANTSMSVKYIADIIFDSTTGVGFAATDSGVYFSSDDFNTWNNLTPNMSAIFSTAQSIGINSDGFVFATFASGSLIRSKTPHLIPEITDVEAFEKAVPISSDLKQNYPNPFNPSTTIQYVLPASSTVSFDIYNSAGQVVRSFIEVHKQAGTHSVTWDGRNNMGEIVGSGTYYYQIRTDGGVQTKKMLLLK